MTELKESSKIIFYFFFKLKKVLPFKVKNLREE
jgi:hypothetical protein